MAQGTRRFFCAVAVGGVLFGCTPPPAGAGDGGACEPACATNAICIVPGGAQAPYCLCPEGATCGADAGAMPDAGEMMDAGHVTDAGEVIDAGGMMDDAGQEGPDASRALDAGIEDAGPGPMDAGPGPMDAGPGALDAGPGATDAGPHSDAGQDAGSAPDANFHPLPDAGLCSVCLCNNGVCASDPGGNCDDGFNCRAGAYCGICQCDDQTCPFDITGDCDDHTNCLGGTWGGDGGNVFVNTFPPYQPTKTTPLDAGAFITDAPTTNTVCTAAPSVPADAGPSSLAYQVNATHTGALVDAELQLPLQPLWTAQSPAAGFRVEYPLVTEGLVFAAWEGGPIGSTTKGQLTAYAAQTGVVVWSVPLNAGYSAATIDQGILYLIATKTQSFSSTITAFDALTGCVLWNDAVIEQFSSYPVVHNGVLYVAGANWFFSVNAADGVLLNWTPTQYLFGDGSRIGPAVTDDAIYVSYTNADGPIFAVPLGSGSGWSEALPAVTAYDAETIGPTIFAGGLLFNSPWLLDAATGALVGTINTPYDIPAIQEGGVLAAIDDFGFHGYDATLQFERWFVPAAANNSPSRGIMSPLIVNQVVYSVVQWETGYDMLEARDVNTGALLWASQRYTDQVISVGTDDPPRSMAAGSGVLAVPGAAQLTVFGNAGPDAGAFDAGTVGADAGVYPVDAGPTLPPGPVASNDGIDGDHLGSQADPGLTLPLVQKWIVQIDSGVATTPVIGNGLVFFLRQTGNSGEVFALDARTGERVWGRVPIEAGEAIAYDEGRVFVSAEYGILQAYDARNGARLWIHELGGLFGSTLTAADGRIFAVVDGVICALDALDGQLLWKTPTTLGAVNAPVSVWGGRVYGGNANGLVCLDERTGIQLWSAQEQQTVSTPVQVVNGFIYLQGTSSGPGEILNGLTGSSVGTLLQQQEQLWPAFDGNTVFQLVGGSITSTTLTAVDIISGASLWSTTSSTQYQPLVANGAVFAGLYGGTVEGQQVLVLDAQTGAPLQTPLVAYAGPNVVFGGAGGSLVAGENVLIAMSGTWVTAFGPAP